MINCENGAPFDPGIRDLTDYFTEAAFTVENALSQTKAFHAKKAKYMMYYPQLKKSFEKNVAFCAACLIWAFYIFYTFQSEPKKITGNNFVGREISGQDTYDDVDLLIEYFDKFERDSKYYFSKKSEIDMSLKNVTVVYKKFLEINENFVKAETTSDLKLPEEITEYSADKGKKALEVLNAAIESKDILKALEFNILK